MASTFSPILRLELQATGENPNTWGQLLNGVVSQIESSIAGATAIDCSTPSTITLTTVNGQADQARAAILEFTGVRTGDVIIVVPDGPKAYSLINNSTGTGDVTIKTLTGAAVGVPATGAAPIVVLGTEIHFLSNQSGTVDAATLDGDLPAFYLDYSNFTGTPPVSIPDYANTVNAVGSYVYAYTDISGTIAYGLQVSGSILHPISLHHLPARGSAVTSGGQATSGIITLTGSYIFLGSSGPTGSNRASGLWVRIA